MMGEVFRKAKSTFIWLGEPSADDQMVMDFLCRTEHDNKSSSSPVLLRDIAIDALRKFFGRPWFHRLWILQEALLSKVPIAHYGCMKVPFSSIVQLCTDLILDNLGNHPGEVFSDCPLKECLNHWERLQALVLSESGGWHLASALPMTEKMDCTLFEDRMYALLGLATAADRQSIRPDYSQPFADVQKHLAAYLLASPSAEPLEALHSLGITRGGAAEAMPTWSRDWTAPRRTNWVLFNPSRHLDADCWHILPEKKEDGGYVWLAGLAARKPWIMGTSATVCGGNLDRFVRFSDDLNTLALKGISVDVVSSAYAAPDANPADLVRSCHHLWEVAVVRDATAWDTSEDRLRAFSSALCLGSYLDAAGHSQTDCLEAYMAWADGRDRIDTEVEGGGTGLTVTRPIKNDFGHRVRRLCPGRSLITTKKGFVGLGPEATRPGDLICYFHGNPDPFLLRRRLGWSEGYVPAEFVGNTLVIGLMDGEGLDGAEEKDVAEYWIR